MYIIHNIKIYSFTLKSLINNIIAITSFLKFKFLGASFEISRQLSNFNNTSSTYLQVMTDVHIL